MGSAPGGRINLRTGWPVYAFRDPGWGDHPCYHVFVMRPDGMALDVEGARAPDALLERWKKVGASGYGPTSYGEIRSYWASSYDAPPYSFRRAKIIAARLVTAFPLR